MEGRNGKLPSKHCARKSDAGRSFDFVYSESSSLPTSLTDPSKLPKHPLMDLSLLALCRGRGLPVGLFYRDVYWRFSDAGQYRSAMRRRILSAFYRADLLAYGRCVSLLYLPSLPMAKHIPHVAGMPIAALPPGATLPTQIAATSPPRVGPLRSLYVGGLGELYDLSLFMNIIADFGELAAFTICTRENDWAQMRDGYGPLPPNIQVVHRSGAGLTQLYDEADVCVFFPRPTPYSDFAVSIKIFEYVGKLKPVLAVRNTHIGNLVVKAGIGWVADFDPTALKKLLQTILDDRRQVTQFADRLFKVRAENTWRARAEQVTRELSAV